MGEPADDGQEAQSHSRPQPEGPIPCAPARGLCVLLVEDEYLVAAGLKIILEEAGHKVRVASGVGQAVRIASHAAPQVVLCDFGLPDGTAWDVAQGLASAGCAAGLVVLTGHSRRHLADHHRGQHPAEVVHKPADRELLLEALRRAAQTAPPNHDPRSSDQPTG